MSLYGISADTGAAMVVGWTARNQDHGLPFGSALCRSPRSRRIAFLLGRALGHYRSPQALRVDETTGVLASIDAECGDGNRVLQPSLEIVGRPRVAGFCDRGAERYHDQPLRIRGAAPGNLIRGAKSLSDGRISNGSFRSDRPLPVFASVRSLRR